MKKFFTLLFMTALLISSCQTKTEIMPVDLGAAEESVTKALDYYNSAFKGKNAEALMSLLSEDGLFCGSDQEELLNKADLSKMMTEAFSDSSLLLKYRIDVREIRVDKSGNSALAMEQMYMEPFSQKIPVRMVYHLMKNEGSWQFDFISWNLIPNNEDLPAINEALK